MRSTGTGGMQTSAAHPTIICEWCKKPAARRETNRDGRIAWMHYGKERAYWHVLEGHEWKRKYGAPCEAEQGREDE